MAKTNNHHGIRDESLDHTATLKEQSIDKPNESSIEAIQDVVNDVLERSVKFGFKPDEDMIFGAVEESANLLKIDLTEAQITEACERVMNPREVTKSRFDTEQEANGYKLKHQLVNRVAEPIGGGKWGLVFPIESHIQVNDGAPVGMRQHEVKVLNFAAGEWNHLFGVGSKETRCRIVIDLEQSKMIAAQEWTGLKFENLRGDRLKDLAESVIEVNEAHANLNDWNLELTSELPAWADQREMSNNTRHTELPPIKSNVSVRLVDGVIVNGVVTEHGQKDGKPTFDFDSYHRTRDGQIIKASKWAWPEMVVQRKLAITTQLQTLDQHKLLQRDAHDVAIRLLYPEQFHGDPSLDGLSDRAAALIRRMAQEIWLLKRIPEVNHTDGSEKLAYRVLGAHPNRNFFAIEVQASDGLSAFGAAAVSLKEADEDGEAEFFAAIPAHIAFDFPGDGVVTLGTVLDPEQAEVFGLEASPIVDDDHSPGM